MNKYVCTVICNSDIAALAIEMAELYVETGKVVYKRRFKLALALLKKTGWDSAKKSSFVKVKGEKVWVRNGDLEALKNRITGRVSVRSR